MSSESRFMAQSGVVLFALTLVNGFLVHFLPLREPLLAAHLAGLLGSLFMFTLASLWPRLGLTDGMSKAGTFCVVYGFGMGWLLNFIAGTTGVFGVFPVSMSPTHQRSAGDLLISAGLLSVVVALFALCIILFLGFGRAGQKAQPAI